MVLTRVSRKSQPSSDAFPTVQLTVLAICRFAEPIALTSIYPIAFPMVKSYGIFQDKDVAFWAGILISSFSLSEAITGCYWGGLSDKVGRKPVLLLGCFGTMISMLMVGFSTSFWMALVARTLGGLLNGNIGVIQTMVGELVKKPEHEPKAYAVMPFVWSIGTIFGPAIGALTANSSLFPTLPWLLPNLICAGLLLFSIIIGYFFLEETRKTTVDSVTEEESNETDALMAVHGGPQNPTADLRGDSYGTFNRVTIEDEWHVRSTGSRPSSIRSLSSAGSYPEERIFTSRVVQLVLALGIYCFHTMAYDHLLPIFAQDDRSPESSILSLLSSFTSTNSLFSSGGLGLSTPQVGLILSVNGMIALFIQGVIFPWLAGWLGVWRLFQAVTLLFPTAYFVVPFLALVPLSLLYSAIYACVTLRNLFSILAYPLILILLKEACPAKHLGRVNGLAASAGAMARCISPPVMGWLYSIGVEIGFAGLSWWAAGLFAGLGALQLVWIKRGKGKASTVEHQNLSGDRDAQDIVRIKVEEVEV